MQLQHFTEGNVPPGLLNAPDGWSPEQIRQFQEWFDSILAGNTGTRTRLVWGPSGSKYQAFKEAPYKDDFDEWLARIVCYAFSLPPTAFTPQVNRATAQTAQDAAIEEGMAPLLGWVKRLVDDVIQNRMGHADLEFAWSDVRPTDPKDQATILGGYVRDGIYALNEARDILGLGPIEGGDEPMFLTAQGPMLLRDTVASERKPVGGIRLTRPPHWPASPASSSGPEPSQSQLSSSSSPVEVAERPLVQESRPTRTCCSVSSSTMNGAKLDNLRRLPQHWTGQSERVRSH
jgi:hypothetical protein